MLFFYMSLESLGLMIAKGALDSFTDLQSFFNVDNALCLMLS